MKRRDMILGGFAGLIALYREGLASLFDVLDAQRQLIASRQSLLDNRADLAIAFIALHSAAASADRGEMSGPIPM